MKTEFLRPRVFSSLLVMLALVVYLCVPSPALAQPPVLDGNLGDFTGTGALIVSDPVGDVGMPPTSPGNHTPPGVTGWDMSGLLLLYHAATDTMYVGIDVSTILGDADGDGNPSVTSTYLSNLLGTDVANLSGSESAAVYFDLNQDGIWDVIAGISGVTDYFGFSVNVFTYLDSPPYFSPPWNFGTPLPTHTGNISPSPGTSHPDLEFTITNWSTLPGQDSSVGFNVGARLGSEDDDGIGEDYLQASFSPAIAIDVEKWVSKDNVNFYDADNAASALDVSAGDSVYFKYIVTNTGNVTLTNITLSDNVHNVSSIAVPDSLPPSASFNGTIGPITPLLGLQTNVATATGKWGGFPVQDNDPANYRLLTAVGGTAFAVAKLRLLAPWAALAGCAAVVALLMLRRRRQA